MKNITNLKTWSIRAKNAAAAVLFLAAYTISMVAPFVPMQKVAAAGPPVLIDLSTHQGLASASAPNPGWTSGNVTVYTEGDQIPFHFEVNSNGLASGVIGVAFSGQESDCLFFTNTFQLSPNPYVTTDGSPIVNPSNPQEWLQKLNVSFPSSGTAKIDYKLTLSQEAGECNGSSQGSTLDDISGQVKNIGSMNVPVPANQIIELPEIVVEKWIDVNGDGDTNDVGIDRLAVANEWSFSLDGATAVPTNANGQVVYVNVTPNGNHTITESLGANDQTFLSGGGHGQTNCSFTNATATATVASGETSSDAKCVFNNTMRKGKIIIEKQTLPNGSTQSFTFTPSYNNGTTFSLSDGQTNTSPDLLAGTYSVAETVPTGWDQTSATCTDGSPVTAISITAGETVTCTFTNTQRGSLVVQKTTIPAADQTSFPITASVSAGASGEIIGSTSGSVTDATDYTYTVKPGTYSVNEQAPSGWEKTGDLCQNIVVAPGASVTCLITNTKLGQITISKNAIPDAAQDFTFTTSGDRIAGFSLDNDSDPELSDSNTFTGLLPGTYTFTEQPTEGWDFTSISCTAGADVTKTGAIVEVRLTAGESVTCAYTNKMHGQIIVRKATNPALDTTIFTVNASSSNGGLIYGSASGSVSDSTDATFSVQQGKTYAVAEVVPTGWVQSSNNCSNLVVNGNSTLLNGVPTEYCDITNTKLSRISGIKWNDLDGLGSRDAGEPTLDGWTINLFGTDINQQIVDLEYVTGSGINGTTGAGTGAFDFGYLMPGTYTVTETPQTNWVQTSTNPAQIVLGAGQTVTDVNFGNRGQGTITVVKHLSPTNDGGTFNLLVDGEIEETGVGHNGTTGAVTVWAGTHTVSETGATLANYSTAYTCTSGQTGLGVSISNITVNAGDNVTCTFTNTRKQGGVKVVKDVVNDNGGTKTAADDFTFKNNDGTAQTFVTTTSPDGERVLTLPVGSTFNIVEPEANAGGYTTSYTGTCSGTVTEQQQTCTIKNDDISPELTVVKLVDNNGTTLKGVSDDFRMLVDATNPEDASFPGDSEGTTISLDVGKIMVNEDSEVYTITTDANDKTADYLATFSEDCDSTIALDEKKTCTVTNTAILKPAIHIVKEADVDVALEGDVITYTFTVTNTGNMPLGNVKVTDPITGNPGFVIGGDTNTNGMLDTGEEWIYTVEYTVPAGSDDIVNVATATGTPPGGTTVTDDDTVTVDVIHPDFTVEKSGPKTAQPSQTVTYNFSVKNTGDVELKITDVVDDIAGQGEYVSGDLDMDGMLDVDETWVYAADYTIPANVGKEIKNTVEVCAYEEKTASEGCAEDSHVTSIFMPQVLGEVAPPVVKQLVNTGASLWTVVTMALSAIGLAVIVTRRSKTNA